MLALVAFAIPTASTAASAAQTTGVRAALLAELNRVRANAHLGALRLDGLMGDAAGAYSRHMARVGRIGHGAWSARVAHSASSPSHDGEVIGWLGPDSARAEATSIVQAWLNSPVHRAVLLDGGFRRVGIGRAVGMFTGSSTAIYTVDFASAR